MAKALPSAELLRRLLRYDAATGTLYWRPRTPSDFPVTERDVAHKCNLWNSINAGKAIRARRSTRYRGLKILGTQYYAHRIIWKLVHGEEPESVDHINGDGFDNRLSNLRSVPHQRNMRNLKVAANNSSGHPGVRLARCGWQARYCQAHLGTFQTFEEALAARTAEEARQGHVTRSAGNRPLLADPVLQTL